MESRSGLEVALRRGRAVDGRERIYVQAPYHPAFPPRARELGGVWVASQRQWAFDVRDEERVRELLVRVYGTDGSADPDLQDVRVRVGPAAWHAPEIWGLGRQICHRPGRDVPVRLGRGVTLLAGQFPARAGSARHPVVGGEGVVLLVRDVPARLVEAHRDGDELAIVPADEPVGEIPPAFLR